MSETIPNNLWEAIQKLDKSLSKEDKEYLLENGTLSVHHSLGRWIRNNWGLWDEKNCVHPATKKQRDLLFSKIKEEGYEWDANKKEIN